MTDGNHRTSGRAAAVHSQDTARALAEFSNMPVQAMLPLAHAFLLAQAAEWLPTPRVVRLNDLRA